MLWPLEPSSSAALPAPLLFKSCKTLDLSTHGMRQLQCPRVGILERGHPTLPLVLSLLWCYALCPQATATCTLSAKCHLCFRSVWWLAGRVVGRRSSASCGDGGAVPRELPAEPRRSPCSPPTPQHHLDPLPSPPDPLVVCSPHRVRLPSRGRRRPNL